MPYYYPEHIPNPSGSFDLGLLETPTETAASSEMASCAGVDDASDPGTATTEADSALEEGNQLAALLRHEARAVPREQLSSLRPTIFSRRWMDEDDEGEEEEEDRDEREDEAIGKLLRAVRKLSRPKGV